MLTGIGDLFSIIMEYEILSCFFRLDGCMKHFCVSLNLCGGMKHFGVSLVKIGDMKHLGVSLVQMGGMKHFTVFPGKGGTKHFLKATARVRNILNFSQRGYETFPG